MRRTKRQAPQDTAFLTRLVLLRNDPALVAEILPLARKGNRHAMYALGLIYAEGRGVVPDPVQAYAWLSCAIEHGDEEAGLLRDMLMNGMSDEQIAVADKIVLPLSIAQRGVSR